MYLVDMEYYILPINVGYNQSSTFPSRTNIFNTKIRTRNKGIFSTTVSHQTLGNTKPWLNKVSSFHKIFQTSIQNLCILIKYLSQCTMTSDPWWTNRWLLFCLYQKPIFCKISQGVLILYFKFYSSFKILISDCKVIICCFLNKQWI